MWNATPADAGGWAGAEAGVAGEPVPVRFSKIPHVILREVLHAHLPMLGPESTVRDAIDKMDIYQFPGLAIVDPERRLLGVITEGDVVRALATLGDLICLSQEAAIDVGTSSPLWAPPDLEVVAALALMMAKEITLLPIVEHERLVGIVLRVDLMQALLVEADETA